MLSFSLKLNVLPLEVDYAWWRTVFCNAGSFYKASNKCWENDASLNISV